MIHSPAYKTKNPSSTQGRRKPPRYHPDYAAHSTMQRHSSALTGLPGADYWIHQRSLSSSLALSGESSRSERSEDRTLAPDAIAGVETRRRRASDWSNRRVRSFRRSRGHPARLTPRSPGSLAGRPTTPVLTFYMLILVIIAHERPAWRCLRRSFIAVDPARFELATFSMPLRRAPNCAMGPYSFVVDLARFELATSSVRLRRAPNCATGPRLPRKG